MSALLMFVTLRSKVHLYSAIRWEGSRNRNKSRSSESPSWSRIMFTESEIPTALNGTMIASNKPAILTKSTFSGLM